MAVNSSSTSNSSLDEVLPFCPGSRVALLIGTAFTVTRAFLLIPLSVLVLYLGHQRWRRQRSFNTTSHCDIITYNMAAMELICSVGSAVYFWGSSTVIKTVGYWLVFLSLCGEGFFHLLTCVERYLAVVHPVTYRGLKNGGGVKIRNISIGCVWLLCFGWSFFVSFEDGILAYLSFFILLGFSSIVVSFCSLSVLRVLIRPAPGEGGRDRERVNQAKRRSFHTVMVIMVVLWLWLAGFLVSYALDISPLLDFTAGCVVKISSFWFNIPSSLVLPLLFLHRSEKLPGCKRNSDPAE